MQPISGPGAPLPGDRPAIDAHSGAVQPLTPAQRTTLERLIVKIMSLSSLKSAELWAGLRHEVGVKNDAGLQARHFPQAEQFLNLRLTQVQDSHATRQLQQQLSDLLPTGNNRQAVSDFIRQQFGHTVLSSLNPDQLRQVLTMLQNGQMAIPQPQQGHATDRTLLPAEHHALNQQISRLAAATGEQPVKLWASLLKVVNLHSGDPIPARLFPLLNQYLQASQTMTQHASTTLSQLTATLKQPLDSAEQRLLEDHSQQRFNAAPQTPLSAAQVQDLLNLLFSKRAERLLEQPVADSGLNPKPIVMPAWGALPAAVQPLAKRPVLAAFVTLVLLGLVLWMLL
ncbi:flagella biosynthesis regulator Flk [Erwinia tasmaniensis]|uniref:Similar to fimbrial chaperone n=1 Tax=Erwinia tasmaniensis (strain DSM 17950 / CFBP 7177 / CIP 109463 / NCPPB 4357 / Et1/99) TaxID=465817 RepID=B2VIZ2_ERWT9|nr:flagella biosynthesis regulator Flk [Erwinia tasmaniensis]CAO96211.1 similar to fimbrial chaperone [Erwinia tasmaniensis Et1/99]